IHDRASVPRGPSARSERQSHRAGGPHTASFERDRQISDAAPAELLGATGHSSKRHIQSTPPARRCCRARPALPPPSESLPEKQRQPELCRQPTPVLIDPKPSGSTVALPLVEVQFPSHKGFEQ